MRVAPRVRLEIGEYRLLETWAKGHAIPYRLVMRARIVLMAAKGLRNDQIAAELRVAPATVGRWRQRFCQKRIAGIEKDAPRGTRVDATRTKALVLNTTTSERPEDGQRWTTRKLAARLGISHSTVHRVWRSAGRQ